MDKEKLLIALQAAYAAAGTDEEREGVCLAAVEIAVLLFPAFRDYKAFLEAVKTQSQAAPLKASPISEEQLNL